MRAPQRWHMCCKYMLRLYLVSCFSSPKTAEPFSLPLCLIHLPTLLKQETEAQTPQGSPTTSNPQKLGPQLRAPWMAMLPGVAQAPGLSVSPSHSTCLLSPAALQLPKPFCSPPPTGGSGEAAGVDANQRSQPRTAVAPRLTHSPKLNTHYTKLIDIN